tara:strand:- start:260 stop:1240 length:981 start_codon:yes stop_codon:yes gene_type:complete
MQKPDKLDVSVIPYKVNYKDEVGLFGVENYFLRIDCKIKGDIVLECFSEVGWSCAYIEDYQLPTGTVTFYPPGSGSGQSPVDTATFELQDAPGGTGNVVSGASYPTPSVSVGDTIYVHQTSSDPQGDGVFHYQWYYRDDPAASLFQPGTIIFGETGPFTTVGIGIFGKHLYCEISYTDGAGNAEVFPTNTTFVATNGSPYPEFENATVNFEGTDSDPNYAEADIKIDKLPDLGSDSYISVELIRKDSGNRFIDAHVDYRLYTNTGHEHPFDKMYIKPNDYFYIGVHARNTKRLMYEFECRIGNEYRPLASIEDVTEIMDTSERPSY